MTKLAFIDRHQVLVDRNILEIDIIETNEKIFNQTNSNRFILAKDAVLKSDHCSYSGDFVCSTNKEFKISGSGLVIQTPGYSFNEEVISSYDKTGQGHLSYIDGCSNSNLVSPPRNGDPCINYLYFPSHTNQTYHTHPSVRIGLVVNGSGVADVNDDAIPLEVGKYFILHRHARHRFRTEVGMSIIIFHPDSEDGPRDEFNPMKTRTYISH